MQDESQSTPFGYRMLGSWLSKGYQSFSSTEYVSYGQKQTRMFPSNGRVRHGGM